MNQLRNLNVTVFGGSGFLGKSLIKYLCENECIVTVPTRNPSKAYDLQPIGDVGQINLIKFDLSDISKLKNLLDDSDIIINLIGILLEKKKNDFEIIHYKFVKNIVDNINSKKKFFINISALGAEKNLNSKYSNSKFMAENYIKKNSKKFSIIKPSIIFGFEDNFFNKFAKISMFSPFLPLVKGGVTKFQPVYVDDVSKGIIEILNKNKLNKVYEFAGPNIYSFKELMQILLRTIDRKRILLYLPKRIAQLMASFFQLFPNPPLTLDQIKLLENNNIISNNNLTFKDLNINPVSLELILPNYLKRFKKY
tara:strand:- start:6572 stop:7498 length:927 start_codon:yes stop_codon:yes gene_type:complete